MSVSSEGGVRATGVPRRILLVEDADDLREVFGQVLEAAGHVVAAAANGEEALARMRASPAPDLIVLDMMMPKMDGWQFRKIQLSHPDFARIPVVVISAAEVVRRSALGAGAAAFLPKPIAPEDLLTAVSAIVGPPVKSV